VSSVYWPRCRCSTISTVQPRGSQPLSTHGTLSCFIKTRRRPISIFYVIHSILKSNILYVFIFIFYNAEAIEATAIKLVWKLKYINRSITMNNMKYNRFYIIVCVVAQSVFFLKNIFQITSRHHRFKFPPVGNDWFGAVLNDRTRIRRVALGTSILP
jgi:hypothetical protein